jgi:diguanylate cyclase (GGDEF)-like protein
LAVRHAPDRVIIFGGVRGRSAVPPAPLPENEFERLAALRSYEVLDTACEQTFDELVGLAAKLTRSPLAAVSLIDGQRQWFKARFGLEASETPRADAFCAYAILGDGPLTVRDATADPRFADNKLVTGEPNIRFYAGVPLVNPDGFALGSLCVMDREARDLDAEHYEILTALAHAAMTTLELRRALVHMRSLALTDALTGIANRPAFLDALARALARLERHGEAFAVLYLDLDGFKRVNDTFGHDAGDAALCDVAATLRAQVRREDTAARIGGDEFAMVLAACGDGDVSGAGERLRAAIAGRMEARQLPVTASVGGVKFTIAPPSVSQAVAIADQIMFSAKTGGKNRVVFSKYPPPRLSDAAD